MPECDPTWAGYGWKLRATFADLRYRGVVVDRFPLVEVDSGELATIPMPGDADSVDEDNPDAPCRTRSRWCTMISRS